MFKKELKEKYSFLTEYFERGLQNKSRLAHSILLYGQDISAQYELATEIARLLNCQEFRNQDCRCLNCNWVREHQHPAVMTVSKIDSKPSNDDSTIVISVTQARMIKNSLLNTSDYHRVFIFCDAQLIEGIWTPLGLNQLNFHPAAANTLLKIIEEPPENTTFFFLTRDKNDLIETIISRSQSFFVPSYKVEDGEYSHIEDFFVDYPELERKSSLDLAQDLFNLSKEQCSEKVLTEIQNFLSSLLKSNLGNSILQSKIMNDIQYVEDAKKQIDARILPQLAFEDLCLKITK